MFNPGTCRNSHPSEITETESSFDTESEDCSLTLESGQRFSVSPPASEEGFQTPDDEESLTVEEVTSPEVYSRPQRRRTTPGRYPD